MFLCWESSFTVITSISGHHRRRGPFCHLHHLQVLPKIQQDIVMSNPRYAGRKSWIKMSQLKGAIRTLKNVRVVAEQPTDNAPTKSSKVRRALFQSNTSLNQDSCNPRHDYPLWRRTQATFASYVAEQVPRETQLQQREERENIPPEEENDEMLYAHGNARTTAKLDRANARHDFPFKRRKDNNNSILSAINQPEAFNGASALRLRTLRSSQKQVPRETQLQQGEERETNIPTEEENHDMLDVQGNDGRTIDAFNGTSALRLRTLRSSQKQFPRETQLQQGEERETNVPAEEENHDMLDAQGNESRTTGVLCL